MKKHDFRFNNSLIISKPKKQERSHFKKSHEIIIRSHLSRDRRSSYQRTCEYLSSEVKKKLQSLIAQMLEKVQEMIGKERSNLKLAMNYVRSSIVFKEVDQIDSQVVDQIVGEYVKNKLDAMQEKLTVKSKELQELKQEIKYEHQFNQIRLKNNSIHISPHEHGIIGMLYTKAKITTYQQFKRLYTQLHGSKRTYFLKPKASFLDQLKNENPKTSSLKKIKVQLSQVQAKKLADELEPFMNMLPKATKSRLLNALQQKIVCMNPCCRWDEVGDQSNIHQTKGYANRPAPTSNRSTSFYRTSDFQKFHSRYINQNFKMEDVVSMTRTRTQEMEKFYSNFKRRQQNKSKQHQRNKSII